MKHVMSFVCSVFMSLLLVSAGLAPTSQAAHDTNAINQSAIVAAAIAADSGVGQTKTEKGNLAPECPINWKPSVLFPVQSHSELFDENDGAPGPLAVYYPSLGRLADPFSDQGHTSVLECGQFPLVIFLHGHCDGDKEVYQRWVKLPEALARSGYVVVVPKLPAISQGTQPGNPDDLDHAKAVLNWMHSGWEHRDSLTSSPGPAIVGHSFGAILGARLVPEIGASAYVSLSASWNNPYVAVDSKVLSDLTIPSLFAWGTNSDESYANLDQIGFWNKITTLKHKIVFEQGGHWDYLPASDRPCRGTGSCSISPSLAADYTALFLSRYVLPVDTGIEGLIPPTLFPPTVARSPVQDLFMAGHLEGIFSLPTAGPECQPTHKVENMTQYLFDRSGEHNAPAAATSPTAVVIPGLDVYNIAYRAVSGHLHELWRAAWGTGTTDLTANASAPNATGIPFAYIDTRRNTEILLFRDSSGTVRSLYWSTGAVGHDNLSGSIPGAPKAAGDPVGYYDAATDTHHVIYRSSNGHLHELWWAGIQPVKYGGDLTALAGAPIAAGQPAAFVGGYSTNIVIYRGSNGHIHSLYWTTGGVTHENLSGVAGTPPALGDPVAYYTAHNDTHQAVYHGNDGRLWELFWQGSSAVQGHNLMENLGAPAPGSRLAAYYNLGTNTKHVFYRGAGLVPGPHEIRWSPGGVRAHINLRMAYEAPTAADGPAAFTVQGPNTDHVTYRGTDNHIYEVILR